MVHIPPANKLCELLRENHANWNEVIQVCKSHRHYAKAKDFKDRNPLHIACLKYPLPPVNAIRAIVKANKHALSSPDVDGMLPIHYICMEGEGSNGQLSILKILIQGCSESILMQDQKGCTPLHMCCESRKGIEFFKCLLNADDHNVADGENSAVTLKDVMRRTPLHFAAIHALDINIIRELVRSSPRAVGIECVRGYCPIHYACSFLTNTTEHIHFLLEQNVRVSRLRGNTGLSCLELLTKTYKEFLDGEETLRSEYIGSEYHGDTTAPNDKGTKMFGFVIEDYWEKAILITSAASLGRTLEASSLRQHAPGFIHDIIGIDRCPPTLISLALVKHPEWLAVKGRNGNLPLHTVASKFISRRCTGNHSTITKLILRRHPGACKEKNNDGKYPLILAIESGKSWKSGLQDMFNAFPGAIHALDLDVSLYPYILSRAANDVSRLHALMTLFPNVIQPTTG